ncbi:restriction endonuclease subunit S [Psychrobacter sp. GP33]|uniref:restriction endonuclease subunit S n=1 Tax=Psychrobacter sp. GP33 TaxID=2758709 RepID=UPI0015FC1131|nr:restriction endonuclease subunit S [Psychrobacter sp. GP33]
MASEVKYVELSSLVSEKPRNGLYKGKEYQGKGFRWIKMGEVFKNDFFLNQKTELLEVNDSEVERFSCKSGDLLFGRTSLTLEGVGDCLLVGEVTDKPIFESNLFRVRFDRKKADPLFYYYYFKSGYGKQLIQKIAKQTAATSITSTDLLNQPVPFYLLSIQNKISRLINQYDQKIELNRQMNETLEAMAQTLFKSWFVDFDPVIDNALAAGNPIPDALSARAEQRQALPKSDTDNQAIQALFPDAFEFTEEMGWIPRGWESVRLNELLEVKYGKDHKKLEEGNIPVYGSGGLMRLVNKSLYIGESILIPRKGTLSNLMFVDEEFWTVDTMFFSIPKINHVAKYLFNQLKLLNLASMNVGSAVPSMTTKVLNDLNILKPKNNVLEEFDRLVTDFFNREKALNEENQTLTKLRDTLLPKLLSGELRITDAAAILEEA